MSYISELAQVGRPRGSYATCIQHINWPCAWQGKYIIVGTIPAGCYDPETQRSLCWDAEAEAAAAIEAAGVTRYQMADCSWNQ